MTALRPVNAAREAWRTWLITPPAGTSLTWTETFAGRLARGDVDPGQALLTGEPVDARLELAIDDVARYIDATRQAQGDPAAPLPAPAAGRPLPGVTDVRVTGGELTSPTLGRRRVTGGVFRAFEPAAATPPVDRLALRMRYRLALEAPAGQPALELTGFKLIENDPGYDSWSDATTLFFRLRAPTADASDPGWSGVLRISPAAFLRELLTFRGGGGPWRGTRAVLAYGRHFLGETLRAYSGPPPGTTRPAFPRDAPAPAWALLAMPPADAAQEFAPILGGRLRRAVVHFPVPDLAFPLNLHRLALPADAPAARPAGEPRQAVLLVPGSGVRAEMFYGQPVGVSLAEHLLRHGFDVWVENWRASIDLPPSPYTWDHAAVHDHPAAVKTILAVIRRDDPDARLRAVVHCQGSISFLMAAVAGLLDPAVDRIVSSAVSLFIEVGAATYAKQRVAVPALSARFAYVDAQWGIRPITPAAAAFAALARLGGPDCGNPTCRIANFMYGSGPDVLLRHRPEADGTPWIAPVVHDWVGREVGATPMTLIAQVAEASRRGHVVRAPSAPAAAPLDYLSGRPQTDASFLFLAGDQNRMFDPAGQRRSADYIRATLGPDRAESRVLAGYGHLDTFWGRRAPDDVFPHLTDYLR